MPSLIPKDYFFFLTAFFLAFLMPFDFTLPSVLPWDAVFLVAIMVSFLKDK